MNRRDFVKVTGIGLFGLFLPKSFRPSWKQTPSIIIPSFDYQLALYTDHLMEVSGAGYSRLAGYWDSFVPSANSMHNGSTIQFPQATESWGTVTSLRMIPNKKKPIRIKELGLHDVVMPEMTSPFGANQKVRKNDTLQFPPGDFKIYLT
jgi:hypothetical protein